MMSVIIRLQNLPWAANAADIRAYFLGLSIPEGGVHIVGGEQGDAFIAFSTDEDARQAMLKDGGKLKEVKIKLFLSSRAEMLRVIEQARQQTLNVQSIIHGTPAVAPVVPQPTANIIVNSVQSKAEEVNEDNYKVKDDDNCRDKRDRYRSSSRERERSRGRDSRDRSRDRSRGKHRDRRRRDRSRSRDRHRRRSRSRDRRRVSRDKDRDGKDYSRSKNKESKDSDESEKNVAQVIADEPSWEGAQATQKVPLLPDPPALPPMLMQMKSAKDVPAPPPPALTYNAQDKDRGPQFPYNPQMAQMGAIPPQVFMSMRGRDGGWNQPPQMVMDPMQMGMPRPMVNNVDMGMQGFPPAFGMHPQMFPGPNPNDANAMWRPPLMQSNANMSMETKNDESDLCIEIRGLPLNSSYIDVKKLFDGLLIPPDGIKMINDNHGNRTGIAYVRFNIANHKKAALNQNGKKVRSNIVEVIHLRDSIFKTAIDNFKPDKEAPSKTVDMDIDSGDNVDESWSREKDGDRERERERDRDRNRERERDRERDGREKGRGRTKNNDPRIKGNVELKEEKRSDCVLLQGLPLNCNENDIADFFDELNLIPADIQLVFDSSGKPVGNAFCQFKNFDEAGEALNKNNAPMGPQMVSVLLVPKIEMDRARQMCEAMWQRPQSQPQRSMPPIRSLMADPYVTRMPNMDRYNNFDEREPKKFASDRGNSVDDREGRFRGENGRPRGRERSMGMRGRGRGGVDRGGGGGRMVEPYSAPSHRGGHRTRGNSREAPNTRPPSPYIDDTTLSNFGHPGCVVSLENLHFRAEIEEIIDFFAEADFHVEHENVIRRFDDNGRPTGDARVALVNPSEAMRAVRLLNFKMLRGRRVKVSLLQ